MRTACRWTHAEKARYYQAELVQDLLGDWTLILCWGGLGSKRGGMRVRYVSSHEEGLRHLAGIEKRRQTRGYLPADRSENNAHDTVKGNTPC